MHKHLNKETYIAVPSETCLNPVHVHELMQASVWLAEKSDPFNCLFQKSTCMCGWPRLTVSMYPKAYSIPLYNCIPRLTGLLYPFLSNSGGFKPINTLLPSTVKTTEMRQLVNGFMCVSMTPECIFRYGLHLANVTGKPDCTDKVSHIALIILVGLPFFWRCVFVEFWWMNECLVTSYKVEYTHLWQLIPLTAQFHQHQKPFFVLVFLYQEYIVCKRQTWLSCVSWKPNCCSSLTSQCCLLWMSKTSSSSSPAVWGQCIIDLQSPCCCQLLSKTIVVQIVQASQIEKLNFASRRLEIKSEIGVCLLFCSRTYLCPRITAKMTKLDQF